MVVTEEMADALDRALVMAEAEYREAVIALATSEAAKPASAERELADVDRVHRARTRVIALQAACEEMANLRAEERD